MGLTPTTTVLQRAGHGTGADDVEGRAGASWSDLEGRLLAGEATCWLGLRSADGVHTRPVFAAWTGERFVVASKSTAVKSRHLDTGAPCSLAFDLGVAHLTVDAVPARLTERADLERATEAFGDCFDWPTTIVGDQIDAPYAAPTSGGPPLRVYGFSPTRAFRLPHRRPVRADPVRLLSGLRPFDWLWVRVAGSPSAGSGSVATSR